MRGPRGHSHDESVEVADFRVCDFYSGGVLVPLDYKLTAVEQLQLLEHSKAKVVVVEYHLWRAIMHSPEFHNIKTKLVLVTEAPLGADLAGGFRWEDFKRKARRTL